MGTLKGVGPSEILTPRSGLDTEVPFLIVCMLSCMSESAGKPLLKSSVSIEGLGTVSCAAVGRLGTEGNEDSTP